MAWGREQMAGRLRLGESPPGRSAGSESGSGKGRSGPPRLSLTALMAADAPLNNRRALLRLAHELERRKPWWWSPRWRKR